MKETVLEAGLTEKNYWRDLWHYRELFQVLAWRDISVRYKQTFVGVAWAVIRPVLTMIILTVVFGKMADLKSDGVTPYAILVFSGLLPWTLFSTALGEASSSLISNANLISKVYFPRIIVPAAAIITAFVDFLIGMCIFFALMIYYQICPGWQIIFLPAFIALALLASLGPGLYITALNVKYRDFRYIIPFIVQFGLYVSPVGYSSARVSEKFGEGWRLFYSLNPVVGVIDGFRWCLFGQESPLYLPGIYMSCGVVVFFLWLGISTFRKMERSFADII